MAATLIFGGVAALFSAMVLSALFHLQWVRRLPFLTGAADGSVSRSKTLARCSVVIAARDEQARIEQTVRHLLAQAGIEIELIIVDDRSTDQTGEILKRLAAEDYRLQVKRVDTLPKNWLGKCHGCHVGAEMASGEWILFTDADCWLQPDLIARAIHLAEQEGVEHVTLTPGIAARSLTAQAWHLAFLVTLANWISGVNRDRQGAYMGLGAFNLMRTSAYRACGGYETLRLTVLDDVKLGLLLRRAGKRTRAFVGVADVECHWSPTVRGMVKLMEKNYFAALDFRLGLALVAGLAGTGLVCAPILGALSATKAGLVAGLAPFLFILPATVLARRLGWPWRAAALTPFMLPVLGYAMLKSVIITQRRGGIWWRDTFYPLDMLRKGTVR